MKKKHFLILSASFISYFRYTSILGNKKFKSTHENTKKSERLSGAPSSPATPASLYPKECNICLKFRVQHKNKKYEPYKIATYDAQRTIKAAAKDKNEKLYAEIESLDLIAKEFKVHQHCYQNFTRGFNAASTSSSSSTLATSKDDSYERGDFEAVKQLISNEVLTLGKAVSMKTIHNVYGLCVDDTRYRSKLKQRIINHFEEKLLFLNAPQRKGEIVLSGSCLDGRSFHEDDIVKEAARLIRADILRNVNEIKETNWPPTHEELSSITRQPPESILTFLNILFKNDSRNSPNIDRQIQSYAYDLVHGVTRGNVIQKKHYLLALGFHHFTGSRLIVDILNKLGHCMSYNNTCDIETAQAELAIKVSQEKTNILPLQPKSLYDIVLTHFWVDNFDVLIDKIGGGGAIITTQLVAYQEESPSSVPNVDSNIINLPRKKSRKLFYEDVHITLKPVSKAPEPTCENQAVPNFQGPGNDFKKMHLVWLYSRKLNSFNQNVPSFKGWASKNRSLNQQDICKTKEVYLPPMSSKVTDFNTIQKYLAYLQDLSTSVNMPFVNITLDVGATLNAYKTIWTYPEQYKNIIIHLGNFHFMKENFQVSIF